jgi:hypothetical protein
MTSLPTISLLMGVKIFGGAKVVKTHAALKPGDRQNGVRLLRRKFDKQCLHALGLMV